MKAVTPFALILTLGLSACASHPDAQLGQRLDALPPTASSSSSGPILPLAELRANSAAPHKLAVRPGASAPTLQDFEGPLLQLRQPLTDSRDQAMRSLSSYVSQSLLSQCSQLCGLQINPQTGGGVAGQLMTFTCDDQVFSLREYLPGDGQNGFSLSRDRVNLLVGEQPAWLQRVGDLTNEGASFLAWEGHDRGYALYTPSVSAEAAQRLLDVAESLTADAGGDRP